MKPWNEMSARERDALVAEKVMTGYERFVYSGTSFIYYGVGVRGNYRIEDNFRFFNLQWGVPTDGLELGTYVGPHFTSEISAAWEVVKQMKTLSCSQQEVFHDETNYTLFNITPEAICRAALKAVGVDIQ